MSQVITDSFFYINYFVLLYFGVICTAALLDVFSVKNLKFLFVFSFLLYALQGVTFFFGDEALTTKLYPLTTHLPIILFYRLVYKKNILSSTLAVGVAYLLCSISEWMVAFLRLFTPSETLGYLMRIIINILLAVIVVKWISRTVNILMIQSRKDLILFGIIPFTYYLFDYISTVFSDWLYSGEKVIIEFLPFILSLSFIVFCVKFFSEYNARMEADKTNRLAKLKAEETVRGLNAIKKSEYKLSILRHDMRHYLQNIAVSLEEGEIDKAKEYLNKVSDQISETALHKYCLNRTVDMILSSNEERFEQNGIKTCYNIELPGELPFSELEFTSILANALENAYHALLEVEPAKRAVYLDIKMKDSKFLLSIRNPYAVKPSIVNGMPQTTEIGHGYGTKSIKYACEKLGGNCRYFLENDMFVLRIII